MTVQIDYEYYEWLISQINIPEEKSYRDLFEIMHNVEFVWTVPNDDNRVQDGLDLRVQYLDGRHPQLNLEGATFLEILVSLSRHLAFTDGGNSKAWAWKLLKNLHLHKKSDPLNEDDVQEVKDILETVIWRTYEPNGRGGFFPLSHPEEDQRMVEIWYQMNKYIIERNSL